MSFALRWVSNKIIFSFYCHVRFLSYIGKYVAMFVVKLLLNGLTNSHESVSAYRVGLRIGQRVFFISINVQVNPTLFLFFVIY